MGKTLTAAGAVILAIANLFTAAPSLGAMPSKEDIQKEIDRLQGSWVVVAVAAEGKDQSKMIQSGDRWVFDGSKATLHDGSRAPEFEVHLDPDKEPKTLDLTTVAEGKSVTLPCIYSLVKDRMRLGFGMSDLPRPAEFTTKKESKYIVFYCSACVSERNPTATTCSPPRKRPQL